MSLNGINPGDDKNLTKKSLNLNTDLQSMLGGKKISISFGNDSLNAQALQSLKGSQSDDISTLLTTKSEPLEMSETTDKTSQLKQYNSLQDKARDDFQQKIKETPKEEHPTGPLTEQQITEYMQLFGKTREEVLADHEKTIKQYKKWNKQLAETKASNGMTLPEAKRVYMELYDKYIKQCGVRVPWVLQSESARREGAPDGQFVGGIIEDVDPSQIESKMTAAELEQFQKAKAAIAELENNTELMEAYRFSETAVLESSFKSAHVLEGSHLATWQATAQKWGVNPEDEISRNQRVRPWFN